MPGSNRSISVQRRPLTGMRKPRHPGSVYAHTLRSLRPFAVQPIRPGEVLDSVSLVGNIWYNSLVDLVAAPMTYAEVAVWYIPLHAYGAEFTALFTTDAEDSVQRGTFGDIDGIAGDVNNPLAEGHIMAGGASQANRPWAGESGAGGASPGSTYVPWVSHGSYIVGDTYYGLDTTLDFRDSQLLANPPFVSEFVRGATLSSFSIGTGIDADPSVETSLTNMIENLFQLSTPDRTFPEILAGFGVDPRRSAGMPVPILTEQYLLNGEPHTMHGQSPDVNSFSGDGDFFHWTGTQYGLNATSDPDGGHIYHRRPLGFLNTQVNINRKRGIRADTFGILMATVVPYGIFGDQGSYGHIFDTTRMTNLGHWGDPSFGGIEELDFITVQDLYNRAADSNASQQAINLLNLLMHGDVFAEHGNNSDQFGYRGAGNTQNEGIDNAFTTKISTQFNIRTDLFG